MQRTTAAEILAGSKNKIFLYGPPGDGKTTLATQLPRTLHIACPPDEVVSIGASANTESLPVLRCNTLDDCRAAVVEALKAPEEIVVFDSTTHLRQLCVGQAIMEVKGPISEATWTHSNRLFFEVLRPLIKDHKHHVIFIGHHRKVKDEVTKQVSINPDFGEGLLRQLIPDLHAAFYYRKEPGLKPKRVLYTTSFPGIELKNRYALKEKYEEPTLELIFNEVERYRDQARKMIDERNSGDRDQKELSE